MGILRAPLLLNEPSAQVIKGSLKFQNDLSTYLTRTPSSAGNRSVYTGSVWVKRTKFAPENNSNSNAFNYTIFSAGTNSANNMDNIKFYKNAGTDDANKIEYGSYTGSYQYLIYTNAKYRDPNGWYNVVWNYDGTTAKLYVNGEQITSFDTNTQNGGSSGHFNNNVAHVIGHTCDQNNSSQFDGYMSQFYWIDGQTLDASYFGFTDPLTNTWRPKKYTGTFGTNGFYLPMDNQDDFEKDKSGNGNDFTKNNFSGTSIDPDIVKDSPSGAVFGGRAQTGITTTSSAPANYCTWNPLSGQNIDLQDGNLDAESGTKSAYATIPSTMAMTSGKYYAEFTYRENINGSGDGSNFFRFGISQTDRNFQSGSDPLGTSKDFGWQGAGTLTARTNGSNSYTYTGNTVADGDILSLAFDADAGKLWIARNGTYATNSGGTGDPANGNNPDFSSLTYSGGYFFVAGPYAGAASPADGGARLSAGLVGNWGQKPFKYTPPKGFLPLNSATARPNTVVPRPDQYVGVTTYVGQDDTLADSTIDTSTAYRYHRILFEGDTNGGSVSEIEFYDANGDKIDASDTNNAGNSVATNATQGLDGWTAFNGTRGGSSYSQGVRKDAGVGSAGFYISKDWGSGNTKIIYGVKVWGVNSYGLAGNTFNKYMKLQGSNNNSSWTDLQTWNSARYGSWTTSSSTDVGHISERHSEISVGHQPDLVFIKNRDSANQDGWFDSLRRSSEGSYFPIHTHSSDAHDSDGAAFTDLTEFTPNGFKLGNQYSSIVYDQNENHVVWTWKAGGNKNTFNVDDVGYATAAAAGLDGGDLTVTGASVGTKQGFSIIKYTGSGNAGDSASHGLLEAPKFIITKNIDNGTYSWRVFTTVIDGSNDRLFLDATTTKTDQTDAPVPTSSVFYVGSNLDHNKLNDNIIAYLWHDVPGLQKFGTYKGLGGSANGSFVELGFRPAIVWVKDTANSNSNSHWCVFDNLRPGFNKSPAQNRLHIDTTDAEDPDRIDEGNGIDILSNGFRVRSNNWYETNVSSGTYIYCAWAEAPASNLFGGQSNAR